MFFAGSMRSLRSTSFAVADERVELGGGVAWSRATAASAGERGGIGAERRRERRRDSASGPSTSRADARKRVGPALRCGSRVGTAAIDAQSACGHVGRAAPGSSWGRRTACG